MARLHKVDPQTCGGPTRNLLGGVIGRFGGTPNLMRILANSPATLEGYLAFAEALEKGTLSSRLRELLCIFVGAWNGCGHTVRSHTEQALKFGVSPEAAEMARQGDAEDARTRATLDFARALLEKQGCVDDVDLAALRAAGLGDADVVEIAAVTQFTCLATTIHHIAQTEPDQPLAGNDLHH